MVPEGRGLVILHVIERAINNGYFGYAVSKLYIDAMLCSKSKVWGSKINASSDGKKISKEGRDICPD